MKKIWLALPITLIFILITATILFCFYNQTIFDRNVYLDGFDTVNNKKQNKDIASFVTDPYDNYAIYKPIDNKNTNDINQADFYGNIDTYDYAPDQDYKMSMWNNDYQCFQWVIKTNSDFNKISVSLDSDDFNVNNDENIKVEYGFSDFVYASNNGNNQFVIREKLIVPEKITSNKVITNVKKEKVYVIFFRVKTLKTELKNINLNLKINGTEKSGKNFNDIKKAIIDIKTNDIVGNDKSDLNLFYFPEWTSYYYNNKTISNFENNEIEYNIPEDYKKWFIKNNYKTEGQNLSESEKYTYNYKAYIDYNYTKYWKNDFEYVSHNYDSDWFQLNVSDVNNYNFNNVDYNSKTNSCNPWRFYRKNMNFLNWEFTGDKNNIKFFTSKTIDKDYFDKNCILYLKIPDSSWEAFDYYLSKCYDSGLRRAMINSIQKAINKYDNGLDIFNGDGFFDCFSSVESMQGQELLKWWINEFKNHIEKCKSDPKLSEVYNNIKFYYYLDERNAESMKITNDIFKDLSVKKWINLVAASNLPMGKNSGDVNDYDYFDIIWVNKLDYYNNDNKGFMDFINKRKKMNLRTAQYSLDSDYTFNLVRSEPGTNAYIYEALANEGIDNQGNGSQYFLRYLINGWYSGKNYYTSDFYELKWVNYIYKSGDTLFSYPECDINIESNYNNVHSYDENENKLYSTKFVPSIRYEMLSQGRKLSSKTSDLLKKNKISHDYLSSNISTQNKYSNKLSENKFNLNYNKTEFSNNLKSSSFILGLLSKNNRDEISALKNIINFINKNQ